MVRKVSTADNDTNQPSASSFNEAEESNTASEQTKNDTKILVVCFSATGNTKAVAEKIVEVTGADYFEIIPAEPYSEDDLNYNDDNCRANREQQDKNARPSISGSIENMDQYEVVLIGHPIWWGMEPRIMNTFMESYDFSGKVLANFCTSGGSGIATSTENLKALSPNANWLEGKRLSGSSDTDEIQEWIDSLKL
ncbi:hypothetical protein HMPREF1094_01870 [[Clostridium] innocuum 2959]|uniref:Flavodoxin-like domain-containing protein n=1 Tax=[Clostridium] innocuum 2959 TaxID=999413 RepID=N9VAP1_CLOIN|nr:flavodoxin [[Clostridium] innocuum]ENY87479.1 hypothetical protein HMPREF1094_01870 [[Clostridium] innocuum 2959]